MLDKFKKIYENKYKQLLVIPVFLLVLAIAQIGYQTATTGDFLNKDVSLKGGMTITVPDVDMDAIAFQSDLQNSFPGHDITVRTISSGVEVKGLIISADIMVNDQEVSDSFIDTISDLSGVKRKQLSIEYMGSSLGESFFRETFTAIILAFVFMGMIVFIYFGEKISHKIIVVALTILTAILLYVSSISWVKMSAGVVIVILIGMYIRYSIPSFAVILAAVSDIVITLAIVNLLGMKIGTAGIAAFLMLIGYSVDTDMLLSAKVLKRKEGIVNDRIYSAMVTGLTMNGTTMAALIAGILLSQSAVITQIMIILLIGLVVDIINTWIQNVGILRLYLEKRK